MSGDKRLRVYIFLLSNLKKKDLINVTNIFENPFFYEKKKNIILSEKQFYLNFEFSFILSHKNKIIICLLRS